MKFKWFILVGCFCVSGCITTQEKENMTLVSGQAFELRKQEIVENIIRTSEDPYTIPRHNNVTKETAEVDVGATPEVDIVAGAGIQTTVTGTGTSTQFNNAPISFKLSGNATWKQSSDMTPFTNPSALKALQSLYRYVVFTDSTDRDDDYDTLVTLLSDNKDAKEQPIKYGIYIEPLENKCQIDTDRCGLKIVATACDDGYRLIGKYHDKSLCANKKNNGSAEIGLKRFHTIETAVNFVLSSFVPPPPPK